MLPLDKHCLSPAAAILHKEKPSPLDLSGLRHPLPSTGHTESPAGQGQELHQGSLRGHKCVDDCRYLHLHRKGRPCTVESGCPCWVLPLHLILSPGGPAGVEPLVSSLPCAALS